MDKTLKKYVEAGVQVDIIDCPQSSPALAFNIRDTSEDEIAYEEKLDEVSPMRNEKDSEDMPNQRKNLVEDLVDPGHTPESTSANGLIVPPIWNRNGKLCSNRSFDAKGDDINVTPVRAQYEDEDMDLPDINGQPEDISSYEEWRKGNCRFMCIACRNYSTNSLFSLWSHVGAKHNLNRTKYLSKYFDPCIKSIKIKCPICNKSVRHEASVLEEHAKTVHSIRLRKLYDIHKAKYGKGVSDCYKDSEQVTKVVKSRTNQKQSFYNLRRDRTQVQKFEARKRGHSDENEQHKSAEDVKKDMTKLTESLQLHEEGAESRLELGRHMKARVVRVRLSKTSSEWRLNDGQDETGDGAGYEGNDQNSKEDNEHAHVDRPKYRETQTPTWRTVAEDDEEVTPATSEEEDMNVDISEEKESDSRLSRITCLVCYKNFPKNLFEDHLPRAHNTSLEMYMEVLGEPMPDDDGSKAIEID